MLTSFGKFCRKLRIDNEELLKDMASKLGVTSSYLSAVENGKRNVPQEWLQVISEIYDLSEQQFSELQKGIEESQTVIKFDLKDFSNEKKDILVAFAREHKRLESNDLEKILKILQGNNGVSE
ncbi:XRE family transcriptional regulator [Brevibacillus nitrificans]|uniref:XRE family transcriptional regulator n=1 Tax=Brevibacillus nitrificans TaxID=651560 RepID=A0A3M8DRQ7_9BACL|nr:helix-turn-helix transcriptional regulator [Brevibacillus nitrificans]RNB90145.1 XRE family transcriptional regulator [Brevibacillus nitrificans]